MLPLPHLTTHTRRPDHGLSAEGTRSRSLAASAEIALFCCARVQPGPTDLVIRVRWPLQPHMRPAAAPRAAPSPRTAAASAARSPAPPAAPTPAVRAAGPTKPGRSSASPPPRRAAACSSWMRNGERPASRTSKTAVSVRSRWTAIARRPNFVPRPRASSTVSGGAGGDDRVLESGRPRLHHHRRPGHRFIAAPAFSRRQCSSRPVTAAAAAQAWAAPAVGGRRRRPARIPASARPRRSHSGRVQLRAPSTRSTPDQRVLERAASRPPRPQRALLPPGAC